MLETARARHLHSQLEESAEQQDVPWLSQNQLYSEPVETANAIELAIGIEH
jgi:hypothetical protein